MSTVYFYFFSPSGILPCGSLSRWLRGCAFPQPAADGRACTGHASLAVGGEKLFFEIPKKKTKHIKHGRLQTAPRCGWLRGASPRSARGTAFPPASPSPVSGAVPGFPPELGRGWGAGGLRPCRVTPPAAGRGCGRLGAASPAVPQCRALPLGPARGRWLPAAAAALAAEPASEAGWRRAGRAGAGLSPALAGGSAGPARELSGGGGGGGARPRGIPLAMQTRRRLPLAEVSEHSRAEPSRPPPGPGGRGTPLPRPLPPGARSRGRGGLRRLGPSCRRLGPRLGGCGCLLLPRRPWPPHAAEGRGTIAPQPSPAGPASPFPTVLGCLH